MRFLMMAFLSLSYFFVNAQAVSDTVTLGTDYANQAWYKIQDGTTTSMDKSTWDLAFAASGRSSTILINPAGIVDLWRYPNGAVGDWNSPIDTSGINTWQQLYNSNETWAVGAFSQTADPNDDFDLGWGTYSMVTHYVTGDSLYVIKTADGSYKKLSIDELSGGTYHFKYANLDGTAEVADSVSKSDYADKNFGYYSLVSGTKMNPEPNTGEWNLLFGQYVIRTPFTYPVSGVLSNTGIEVARAENVANPESIDNYNDFTFETAINQIGYDWKDARANTVNDSIAFFLKTKNDSVWRIHFTGFANGSNGGQFIFSKENLGKFSTPDSVFSSVALAKKAVPGVKLYPNPASGNQFTLLLDQSDYAGNAVVSIHNINGAVAHEEQIFINGSFQQSNIEIAHLSPGAYVFQLATPNFSIQQKLIVQ